jgi:hypothetical protein
LRYDIQTPILKNRDRMGQKTEVYDMLSGAREEVLLRCEAALKACHAEVLWCGRGDTVGDKWMM